MFTKEEVFVATDGSIHREQLAAETASFAHFMEQRNYQDEDGDTGKFAVEAFFYQLKRKPDMLAWMLAQLQEEQVPTRMDVLKQRLSELQNEPERQQYW